MTSKYSNQYAQKEIKDLRKEIIDLRKKNRILETVANKLNKYSLESIDIGLKYVPVGADNQNRLRQLHYLVNVSYNETKGE